MKSESRLTFTLVTCIMFMLKLPQEADADCQKGWERFEGSCYKFIANKATYPNALNTCGKEGYDLLEVNSEGENTFLHDFLTAKKVRSVWHGINDLFVEGRWVYSRTGTRVNYTYWYHGEPNNRGGEDCAEIDFKGFWNDMSCNFLLDFICEHQYTN